MATEYPIGDPFGGAAYGEKNDPVTAAIVGATALGGAYISSQGAQSAAQTQANAGLQAQGQVLQAGQQAVGNYTPYQNLGTTAINQLNANLPYLTRPFTNQDLNANLAPNYAFGLDVGQRTTNAANNALSGFASGNAQKALQDYSQNFAQNAYQNAFGNFNANQTNIYNRLTGLASLGLSGATGAANAQIGTGTNIAGITQGIGNAQAGADIASSNAYGGALTNAGNLYALSSLIGKGGGGNNFLNTTSTGLV